MRRKLCVPKGLSSNPARNTSNLFDRHFLGKQWQTESILPGEHPPLIWPFGTGVKKIAGPIWSAEKLTKKTHTTDICSTSRNDDLIVICSVLRQFLAIIEGRKIA